jgi:hypothetical protein
MSAKVFSSPQMNANKRKWSQIHFLRGDAIETALRVIQAGRRIYIENKTRIHLFLFAFICVCLQTNKTTKPVDQSVIWCGKPHPAHCIGIGIGIGIGVYLRSFADQYNTLEGLG